MSGHGRGGRGPLTYRLRDSSGLVWPSMFPVRTDEMKLDPLEEAAALLDGMAGRLAGAVDGVADSWAGLQGGYVSPEAARVYALMEPAQAMAEQVDVRLRLAAVAVRTYAEELAGLRGRIEEVVGACESFRASCEGGVMRDAATTTKASFGDYARAAGDWIPGVDERKVLVPWNQDQDLVTRNEELIEQYSQVVADVTRAAARCANTVNGLPGLPLFLAPQLGGVSGVSPEQLVASWGPAATEDRSCVQATGAGVYNNAQGALVDAAAHLGRDPETKKWWSGSAASTAWKGTVGGTVDLAGSALVGVTPVGWFLVMPSAVGRLNGRPEHGSWAPQWFQDRGDTLGNAVGAIVGGDPAEEDLWAPYRDEGGDARGAFGGALFNIASIVLPTKAALLKTGRVADVEVPGGRWADQARVRGVSSLADLLGSGRRAGGDLPSAVRVVDNLNQARTTLTTLDRVPDNWHRPVSDDLFNRSPRPDSVVHAPSTDHNPAPPVHDRAPVPATARTTDTITAPRPAHPDPAPGRVADTITTQPIEGLPRPSHGAGDGPGPGRPGSGAAGDGPSGPAGGRDGPAGGEPAAGRGPDGGDAPRVWDRSDPAVQTVPGSDAPVGYGPEDVARVWDEAPVDVQGRRVDHRTGEPLVETRADGSRGWHMVWDPEGQRWMAERPGDGFANGMPETGVPNSFGYDADGNLLRWANDRPEYAPGQVEAVWEAAPKHLDENGKEYVEVRDKDNNPVRVYWEPGQPRQGLWDMGHIRGEEYRRLRDDYLSHEIDEAEFLRRYHDSSRYAVQDPGRNRAHMDEDP